MKEQQPGTGPVAGVPGSPQLLHTSDATHSQHVAARELMDLLGVDLVLWAGSPPLF